jgi:Holliday junction resolvase-like predicted endonuclease
MLESRIESQVVVWAQARGWVTLKLNVRGRRGWPDRIFIRKGKVIFIEFKAPGGRPTKLQLHMIGLLGTHHMSVYLCDSKESAIETLKAHM